MPEFYGSRAINWTWYLVIEREPDGCRILEHFRLHCYDESQGANAHPATLGSFDIIEDDDRTARQVELRFPDGKLETLDVTNPRNVFDYGRTRR